MGSINFIGGEKGGVGKSVTARLLAQYLIDKDRPFTGFDTDRSHHSFNRFYQDHASPVVVDSFEGLDLIVSTLEASPEQTILIDMAAQTSAPLSRWIHEAGLIELFLQMGIMVNFWHVMDDGKDAVDLLARLLETYGYGPNYIVVQNHGRGANFAYFKQSDVLKNALHHAAHVIELPRLHDSSMRKIDQHSTSFWKAVNDRESDHALGLLERQRVKIWLKNIYKLFDTLPL